MPNARSRSPLAALLAILALAACDITGPHHIRSDLRGRYDGRFTLEWEPLRHGRGGWIDGHGAIRVFRHGHSHFSGEFEWFVDGELFRGHLERGRERFRDEVSFRLDPRFGHDLLEEATGCFFVRGDHDFHGRARHRRLFAERSARVRCHDGRGFSEDLLVRLSFEGWR